MGQFASTLFQLLLGWVQRAISALWAMIVSPTEGGGLAWLLEHWLVLLVLLCAVGTLIDFAVYLLRWQPYRVWRAFLHGGHTRHADHPAEEDDPRYQRRWVYADGTTTLEDLRLPPVEQDEQLELPIRPVHRVPRQSSAEHAYYQPVFPKQRMHAATDSEGENE